MSELFIDIGPLSCGCSNGALEYLHKAMQDDGNDIFRPHENIFIRKLVEQMSDKGTDALAKFQDELGKWMKSQPTGQPTARPQVGKFVRWTETEMQAVRLYFSALPRNMWTMEDYGLLIDYLVQRYFPDDPSHMADYFVKRAMLMGRMQAAAENATEKQAEAFLEHFRQEKELELIERMASLNRAVFDYGVTRCADMIQAMHETTRHRLKTIILDHQKNAMLSGNSSGPSLQTKLFDAFGQLNRDWRRIAITEIGENANQGMVASCRPGEKLRRVEQYVGACAFCKRWNGRILTVVDPSQKKKDWDNEIWAGKTNIGRSVSPYKRTEEGLVKRTDSELYKPASGLFHPHCRGMWVKVGKAVPDDFTKWLDGFLEKVK